MKTFTIDTENNVSAFAHREQIEGTGYPVFASEAELTEITADWPMVRFVEIWNSVPGVTPVKRFTSRIIAARRIWGAIQSLDPMPAKRADIRDKKSPASLPDSKKAQVLTMLERPDGATVLEVMTVTGWQSHTVRGFVSGSLMKKMELPVQSFRRSSGERAYRVASKNQL